MQRSYEASGQLPELSDDELQHVVGGSAGELQELNMSFNLQYLQLQQQMQSENRKFTVLSNVMKAKHDLAQNSISNVR